MNVKFEKNTGESAYLQLYKSLREAITAGLYPYGSRLPSKRVLAEQSGVSVITVQHAYALLCDEGYAESRERSGYYVNYKPGELLHPASVSQREAADYAAVPGSAFPFSVYARTARRVLNEYGERLWARSPNNGTAELRRAIGDYLGRSRGIRVDSEQIIIGAGAEYLYGLIVKLLGKKHRFAIEDPSYEKIRLVYEANGASPELLPLGPDGVDSERLNQTNADVLHVTPYHSFPSGVSISASKKWEYIRWAQQRNGYLVEDDYDSEFSLSPKAEDSLFSLSPEGHVIYINSFSKSVAPSIRAGYMLLPPALYEEFSRRLSFYSCAVPLMEQYILAELLNSGDFERHINRVRRRLRKKASSE